MEIFLMVTHFVGGFYVFFEAVFPKFLKISCAMTSEASRFVNLLPCFTSASSQLLG